MHYGLSGSLIAFVIIGAIYCYVAVALYGSVVQDHTLSALSSYRTAAFVGIGLQTITSFVPFPAGFILGSIAWLMSVACLSISTPRKCRHFAFLFAGLIVGRHVVLGILDATK